MNLHTLQLYLVLYAGLHYHALPYYAQQYQRTALRWFDIRSNAWWNHTIPKEWLWNEQENKYA